MISLGFLKNRKFRFALKSKEYSVLYYLTREDFESCLKENEFDYQLWCSAKDKDEYLFGENEIYECKVCQKDEKHDPFDCPKLHYLPIKQHIINKHLHDIKMKKMSRLKIQR